MSTVILFVAATVILVIGSIATFYLLRHNTDFPISLESFNTDDLKHGITYAGDLEGNPVFIQFHEKVDGRYGHQGDDIPPSLRLWLPSIIDADFRITRENKGDKAAKKLGISQELQTGDEAFDQLAYIHTHSPSLMENFLFNPENRAIITHLFEQGFTRLSHNGKALEVESRPFSTGNFSQPTFIRSNLEKLLKLSRNLASTAPGREGGGLFVWKSFRLLMILLAWLILFAGLGLMFYSINVYMPLDSWDFFKTSFPFSLALTFFYLSLAFIVLKKRSSAHRDLGHIGLVSMLGFPPLVFGMALFANGQLDNSSVEEHNMPVLYKNIRHSKNSTTYIVTVKSWRPMHETESLQVEKETYQSLEPKRDRLKISTARGYLDYEWLINVSPQILSENTNLSSPSNHSSGPGTFLQH